MVKWEKLVIPYLLGRWLSWEIMSTSIAARMSQLLATSFTYQPGVRTNFEVIVLYAQVKVIVLSIVTIHLARDSSGSKPDLYRVRRRLIL